MMANSDVDIFVGNNILIDPDVYVLWLSGLTSQESVAIQQRWEKLQQFGASLDMLLSDVQDHYRTFLMLEHLLKNPPKMSQQLQFQIAPGTRTMLIEKYYEFDPTVIREILGKKLSSRNRNSLDDVSDKTRVPLRSCRRQFDNVKRVFKTVEEMMGTLPDNIKTHFHLSDSLAKQYAAIVFMANSRFETSKKKLAYITFEDFAFCANEMIVNWSYSSEDCKDHKDMDVDLDRDFLHGLRDVKLLAEKDQMDEHRTLVCKMIHARGKISPAANADMENNFRNYSKTIVNIAYGLNHSKELKDFFLDLVEKFTEPCRSSGWTIADIKEFLQVYQETSCQLDFFNRQSPSVRRVWDRYMKTVTACILRLFHS